MEIKRENIVTVDRVLTVISSEKINSTSFYAYSEIDRNKVNDVKRGKSTFSNEEIIRLKSEVNKFRIELKSMIADLEKYRATSTLLENKFRKFLEKKYIKPAIVFDKETYTKLDGWKMKRRIFPDENKQNIIDSLSLLILETSV